MSDERARVSIHTGRMRPHQMLIASLLALLLGGCTETEDEGAAGTVEATTSPSSSPEPSPAAATTEEGTESAPSAAPSPEATSTDSEPSIPSRAEMDDAERMLAAAFFVEGVRSEDVGQLYTDEELLEAGNAACDALDGGKPMRGVFVDVAETLPRLESTEAVAILAGYAQGTLCAEHSEEDSP